jgi:hypothetical protein
MDCIRTGIDMFSSVTNDSSYSQESKQKKENIPLAPSQNIPLGLWAQYDGGFAVSCRRRRYNTVEQIEKLAVEKYKKNGMALTFNDLISTGLASNKKQSQITLKYYHRNGTLFTISAHKPQQYYPACLKSEIKAKKMKKNIPIGVTGVGCCSSYSNSTASHNSSSKSISGCSIQNIVVNQSLEGYVLPLLPSSPLFIHKMQFKLKITPECYSELNLPVGRGNKGKEHVEVIGNVRVCYRLYANGTVMVFTESSNNPLKLEDEVDRSRIIAFFGQVRDRLITFLMDIHERIVPDIMEWELTEFDINKDVNVSDWFQFTGLKIQIKHLDRIFRIYIKSIGKDTACRVEESLNPMKPAVQAINEIFSNPNQREQQGSCIDDSRRKITEIHDMLKSILLKLRKHDSAIGGEELLLLERGGS